MEDMVVAFLFSYDRQKVALIKKERPEWQKGRLNGIGGHIEEGEDPFQAVIREVYEEANVNIPINWYHDVTLTGSNGKWRVNFFHTFCNLELIEAITDEEIIICDINNLPPTDKLASHNVNWLIPLALDKTIHKPLFIIDD